jgi:hypothetical protein
VSKCGSTEGEGDDHGQGVWQKELARAKNIAIAPWKAFGTTNLLPFCYPFMFGIEMKVVHAMLT